VLLTELSSIAIQLNECLKHLNAPDCVLDIVERTQNRLNVGIDSSSDQNQTSYLQNCLTTVVTRAYAHGVYVGDSTPAIGQAH
jgi:hypothetical protein